MTGPELLTRAKSAGLTTEILIMTAYGDLNIAVSAVKAGAFQFLTKPFASNEAVVIAVRNAVQRRQLTHRTHELEKALEDRRATQPMLGSSRAMLEMLRLVDGVAPTHATVLILGESGAGKELVARAIHERSARATKPLITVNCAAIPKELVESELFGHIKGAFTGAQTARAGLFEAANGGTLFLDEVGDLPMAAQVKLLRTLQSGEVRRVGSDTPTMTNVRVLAATNVDLKAAIEEGRFRRDFYYRLNVITIRVPPLRARRDDIALLAHEFVAKSSRSTGRSVSRIAPDALRAMQDYEWPGNVRELEHAIEHAVILAPGDTVLLGLLPFVERPATSSPPGLVDEAPARSAPAAPAPSRETQSDGTALDVRALLELPYPAAKAEALVRFNELYVAALMHRTGSNVSEAARQSGLDRSNFRRLMRTVTPRNED
jgi:DNA-binding NtrC family response regulator